jgi:hypothetical protein
MREKTEKAKLSEAEIERLLGEEFPQMFNPQGGFAIDEVWFRGCRVRKRFDPQSLRPGGTIAGTTMMALADQLSQAPGAKGPFGRDAADQARQKACGGGHRHTLRGGG